jgi:tetratricopeptide (TPR) repeat protein
VFVAIILAGAVCAAVDWSWEIPAVFGPVLVAAGLLTASAPSRVLARDSYWLGAATVAAAWVAMIAAGLVVVGELEMRESRSAAAGDNLDKAIASADHAHVAEPWSPEPYTQLALLEEERGNYGEALTQLQRAEARDSDDWRLLLIEARLQSESGNDFAAQRAFVRAHSLNRLLPGISGFAGHQG